MPHDPDLNLGGVTRSQGRRKSRFPAKTVVDAGASFDYVVDGTNFKISGDNLIAALGATGTIAQSGAVTGTPVLDAEGSVNNIRNLESGAGINASVSPENGITLKHNFINGTVGAPLIKDISQIQPTIRSVLAGNGIAVAIIDDHITVSVSGTAESTKTVVVSALSDLPDPDGGAITLADDADYLFVQDISTPNRFIVGANTVVRAASSQIILLTYTGVDAMFTGIDPNFKVMGITVDCPNGSLLDMTSPGNTGVLQIIECNVQSCNTGGTVSDMFITRFDAVGWEDIKTKGVTYSGVHQNLIYNTGAVFLLGGDFIDLGTATFNNIQISNNSVEVSAAATVFIKGAADSANVRTGGLATAVNNRLSGLIAGLSGITSNDARWDFLLNDDIPDTRTDGLLSMQGNATATVIASAGTGVLVAGTWVIETEGQMTGTTAGRLTLDLERSSKLPITASVTVEPVSGGTQIMSACIAIDGTVVANSLRTSSASPGSPTSITVPWQEDLPAGSFSEVFVSNESGTTNVLVSSAVHRIN